MQLCSAVVGSFGYLRESSHGGERPWPESAACSGGPQLKLTGGFVV